MIRLRYGRRKHTVEIAKKYDKSSLSITSSASDSVIVAFDDFRQENELVYSITVNHHEKYVVRLRLTLDYLQKGPSKSTSSDFFFM